MGVLQIGQFLTALMHLVQVTLCLQGRIKQSLSLIQQIEQESCFRSLELYLSSCDS